MRFGLLVRLSVLRRIQVRFIGHNFPLSWQDINFGKLSCVTGAPKPFRAGIGNALGLESAGLGRSGVHSVRVSKPLRNRATALLHPAPHLGCFRLRTSEAAEVQDAPIWRARSKKFAEMCSVPPDFDLTTAFRLNSSALTTPRASWNRRTGMAPPSKALRIKLDGSCRMDPTVYRETRRHEVIGWTCDGQNFMRKPRKKEHRRVICRLHVKMLSGQTAWRKRVQAQTATGECLRRGMKIVDHGDQAIRLGVRAHESILVP